MRLPILNFKSISQFWQPWARNWQHCGSEKYAFVKNPTPPTVFASHSSHFAQTITTKYKRVSRSRIFHFHSGSPLKKFKMGGRIDTILMSVKIGDVPISSLDFSIIGRVSLKGRRSQEKSWRFYCFIIWFSIFSLHYTP